MKIELSKILREEARELTEKEMIRKRNSEEMAKYLHIIQPIAGKYGRDWCLNYDDVFSELCFKVLTLGNECGWENLNEKLVARICYNRAVDLYRAGRKKWEKEMEIANHDTNGFLDLDQFQSKVGNSSEVEEKVFYEEFLSQYTKGTREYTYLVITMTSDGLIGNRYIVDLGIELPNRKLNESDICQILGLSPKSHSLYKMKNQLREELRDWLSQN